MQTGFNTDIEYQKVTFHVQTEESGPENPVIITHLFHKGAILSSKKTHYGDKIDPKTELEKLKELMKKQHEEMIQALLSGNCNHLVGNFLPKTRKKSLDEHIDEYIKQKQ